MQRYDLMTYSGVMHEWKRRTMGCCHYRFEKGVLPKDKSWQVILLAAVISAAFAAMFVGWWMCAW